MIRRAARPSAALFLASRETGSIPGLDHAQIEAVAAPFAGGAR